MGLVNGSIVPLSTISSAFNFVREHERLFNLHRGRSFDRRQFIEIARLESHNGVIAFALVFVILLYLWRARCAVLSLVKALSIIDKAIARVRFALRRGCFL